MTIQVQAMEFSFWINISTSIFKNENISGVDVVWVR